MSLKSLNNKWRSVYVYFQGIQQLAHQSSPTFGSPNCYFDRASFLSLSLSLSLSLFSSSFSYLSPLLSSHIQSSPPIFSVSVGWPRKWERNGCKDQSGEVRPGIRLPSPFGDKCVGKEVETRVRARSTLSGNARQRLKCMFPEKLCCQFKMFLIEPLNCSMMNTLVLTID